MNPRGQLDAQVKAQPAESGLGKRPPWQRTHEICYAAGFILRTKVAGWTLFCERMNLPPFVLCEHLPGFDRLQRALARSEKSAFTTEGMVSWLNAIRPKGEPETTVDQVLSVKKLADEGEDMYRQRVAWWGG